MRTECDLKFNLLMSLNFWSQTCSESKLSFYDNLLPLWLVNCRRHKFQKITSRLSLTLLSTRAIDRNRREQTTFHNLHTLRPLTFANFRWLGWVFRTTHEHINILVCDTALLTVAGWLVRTLRHAHTYACVLAASAHIRYHLLLKELTA